MVSKITLFIKGLNEKKILLLLLGITFGLRLYAVLMAKGIANDSASYGFMARDFLKGNFIEGLSPTFHPFYPFLISLVSFNSTHVEIAGRLISLFFGTLTLIPVFYLVKEAVGQKEAILSSLFYSFHPYLVTYSGMLLSEATYWGLLTLSVYFFWMGLKRGKILGLIVSGVFLALAYLTRPEGIGYLFIFLMWVIIYGGIKKEWFKKLALIGALILPLFILTIPYFIHIHRETGQWLISKKAVVVQSQLSKLVEEKGDYPREKIIEEGNPIKKYFEILETGKNIFRYFPFAAYHYLRAYHFTLWLFLFFGLISLKQNGKKYELFLISLVLFHIFSLATFTTSTIRFSVPLIPLTLFWAGAGVLEIQKFFRKIKITKPKKWLPFLIILAILVQLPQSLIPERRHRADQRSVGLWLKENTPKDAIIMSNSPQETFYADREFVLLPSGISTPENLGKSYREIIQLAKQKGIRYILVNKNTPEGNPGFIESIRKSDLREFYKYREKKGDIIIVYEVIY